MFDKDVDSYSRNEIALIRQNISVVFQDYKLLKHLNVFDNLALPLRIKGDSEETIARKVTQIVKWVGLKQYIDSYPDILSRLDNNKDYLLRVLLLPIQRLY